MCTPAASRAAAATCATPRFLEQIKDPAALFITVVAGAPFADPAVRPAHFAGSFPHHASSSICDGENATAVFTLGGDVRQLITRYEQDRRGDLDRSYGCAAGGRPARPLATLALLLLTAWGTRTSRRRGSGATTPPRCAPRRRRSPL